MNSDSYVDFFRQTSPYIHKHRGKTFVIALDGDTVAHANFHRTIHDIALLQSLGIRIVLVHGARPQIDQRIAQAGEQSQFHNQLRITDSSAMQSVKEALAVRAGKSKLSYPLACLTLLCTALRLRPLVGILLLLSP
jgi:amino-acid N-acetyltransferase